MTDYNNYVGVKFSNVKVQWAKLSTPDEFRGSKKFKLEMYFESADELEKSEVYKTENFNVRTKNDKVILGMSKDFDKAKFRGADGLPCIQVVGPDGVTPFTDDIGNGTVVNINGTAKKWDVSDKVTLYIDEVQVVEHVAYAGGGGFASVTAEPANSIGV
jgi:hypothetical protein